MAGVMLVGCFPASSCAAGVMMIRTLESTTDDGGALEIGSRVLNANRHVGRLMEVVVRRKERWKLIITEEECVM